MDQLVVIVIIISAIVILLLFVGALVFHKLMSKQRKMWENTDLSEIPKQILERYFIWYNSFSVWTIINVSFTTIATFSSLASIYFAANSMSQDSNISNKIVIVFSLLSALFTSTIGFLSPKSYADGFYLSFTKLEMGILRFQKGLITLEKLIEIYEEAEKYTYQKSG